MMKNKIRQNFNKAAKTYDAYSQLQIKISGELLAQLNKYVTNTAIIADFGCGTGNSTQQILSSFTCEKLYALDFADQLLEIAKTKIIDKRVKFYLNDFEIQLFSEGSLNLAFANMSLQWSLQPEKTLSLLYQQLAKNGILAFTIPLIGTFPELVSSSKNKFYSLTSFENQLINLGFKILFMDEQYYPLIFSSSLEAIKSLKSTGANSLLEKNYPVRLAGKKSLATLFTPNYGNTLTYHIGYFIVKKVSVWQ